MIYRYHTFNNKPNVKMRIPTVWIHEPLNPVSH